MCRGRGICRVMETRPNRFVLTQNWSLSWSKLALWKPGLKDWICHPLKRHLTETLTGVNNLKPCTILHSIEIGQLTLFNSFVNHGHYTATCSVTIKKTGKEVNLDLFTVISALCFPIYDWKSLGGISQAPFVSIVKQFCENTNSFMVVQPKPIKFRYFFLSDSRWTAVKQVHCPSCIMGDAEWRPSKWEN